LRKAVVHGFHGRSKVVPRGGLLSGFLSEALDGVAALIEQFFYGGQHVFGTNVGEGGELMAL
jgi:hypothetical protein